MFFQFDFDPYIAIIGDIVESKKIENRLDVQKNLKKVLDDINAGYPDDIASPFMITLGDEFQGLLINGGNVIDIIEYIQIKMDPVRIRFGVGVGKIETEINRFAPFGADGSAYHNARDMIAVLKNTEKKNKAADANIMIGADGDNAGTVILLNIALSLCTAIRQRWTDRQKAIAFEFLLGGDSQRGVAEKIGVSQSFVHKSLYNADYYSYRKAMDTVARALAEIKGDRYV